MNWHTSPGVGFFLTTQTDCGPRTNCAVPLGLEPAATSDVAQTSPFTNKGQSHRRQRPCSTLLLPAGSGRHDGLASRVEFSSRRPAPPLTGTLVAHQPRTSTNRNPPVLLRNSIDPLSWWDFVAGGIFYSNKALDAKAFYPIAATVIPVLLIPLVFQLPRDRPAHAPTRLAVQVTIAMLVLGEASALIAIGAPAGPLLPSRARRSAHALSRAAHGRAPLSPGPIQATRPHPDHHLPLVGAALAAGLVGILVAAFPQSSPDKGGATTTASKMRPSCRRTR